MTPSTLSAELARALGYYPESVREVKAPPIAEWTEVFRIRSPYTIPHWFKFDYRDPTVCLPLIEWLYSEDSPQYNPWFSIRIFNHEKRRFRWSGISAEFDCSGATLPEAVARAAISVAAK